MAVQWQTGKAPATSQEKAAIGGGLTRSGIFPPDRSVLPFDRPLEPDKDYKTSALIWGDEIVKRYIIPEWTAYKALYWRQEIIILSEQKELREMAVALLFPEGLDKLPDRNVEHIFEECKLACMLLKLDSPYSFFSIGDLEEALHLAVITNLILSSRRYYHESLVDISHFYTLPAPQELATSAKDAGFITTHYKTYYYEHPGQHAWSARQLQREIEQYWHGEGPKYSGRGRMENYRSTQGIYLLDSIPLYVLVFYCRVAQAGHVKGQRETDRVNAAAITIWSIAAGYAAGGLLASATGLEKLKAAGPWTYDKIKSLYDKIPQPIKDEIKHQGTQRLEEYIREQLGLEPPALPPGIYDEPLTELEPWHETLFDTLKENWKIIAAVGGVIVAASMFGGGQEK